MENKENREKIYDIYYHNDFDGVSAAAVFVNFVLKNEGKIKSLNPINYSCEQKWASPDFFKNTSDDERVVILDFFYHPRADFWFDHHPTTFLKKEWRKNFQETKFQKIDSSYYSATHLVKDSLVSGFHYKPSKFIQSLVYWADIIDGARYRNPQEATFSNKPAILLAAIIYKHRENHQFLNQLVQFLAKLPFSKIMEIPVIKKNVKAIIKERQTASKFFEENMKFYDNKVAFIDLSSKITIPHLRFFSYFYNPKVIYTVAITKGKNLFYLHLHYNPWKHQKPKIDLGKFLKKYNGGGHLKAAGAEFESKTKTYQAVKEIIDYLLKNG